jgi:hypothetical protein
MKSSFGRVVSSHKARTIHIHYRTAYRFKSAYPKYSQIGRRAHQIRYSEIQYSFSTVLIIMHI